MDDPRSGGGRRSVDRDRAQPAERRPQRHLGTHPGSLIALLLLGCLGCSDAPSILLRLSSELVIPAEADALVVRVYSGAESVREERYVLGTPPRDRWPQTLPLLSGGRFTTIGVGAELQHTPVGGAPEVVGYGAIEVAFPSSGSKTVDLMITRGCTASSCPEHPDGGVEDAACGGGCGDAEVCFENHCRPGCDIMNPCTDQNQIICQDPGVCVCTLPCQDGGCFPHACLANGCCKLQ